MAHDGLVDDLRSLVDIAEDVRDGRRTSFPKDEVGRLCTDLRRAIERLTDAETAG
jgi:hypothetical protein